MSAGRFAIVLGTFYADLAARLEEGARAEFDAAGAQADTFPVPGAFELPLGALYAAQTGRYAGVACLGAVIRGQTSHYDHVCQETAHGIAQVGLSTGVPCSFGVLTVENLEQALDRLGGRRHQGRDAAHAVLTMAGLRAELAA